MPKDGFIKDENTLFINFPEFNSKTNKILETVSDLDFKTDAFDGEGAVCGTESMVILTDMWHGVADTTFSYKNFCAAAVMPAVTKVLDSFEDQDNEIAGNISSNPSGNNTSTKDNAASSPQGETQLSEIELNSIIIIDNWLENGGEVSLNDMKTVNGIMCKCFKIETIDGEQYLVYDEDYINSLLRELENAEDKTVLYGLLTDMKNNMPEDKTLTKYNGSKPTYQMTISKLGDWYTLNVTADSSWLPGEELSDASVACFSMKPLDLDAIKNFENLAENGGEAGLDDMDDMKYVNDIMLHCFRIKTTASGQYLIYDDDYINSLLTELENADDKTVLYGLLTDLKENMPEDKTLTKFNGSNPTYQISISKLGAGFAINVTADSSWLPGRELSDLRVAYTSTEKSSLNYFKNNDGTLNWDSIKEWLGKDPINVTSIEYEVFAALMIDMSDENLEKIISYGQVKKTGPIASIIKTTYAESENLKLVASIYTFMVTEARANAEFAGLSIDEIRKLAEAEARALAFSYAVKEIDNIFGMFVHADITLEGENGEKAYVVSLTARPDCGISIPDPQGVQADSISYTLQIAKSLNKKITVYPRTSDLVLDQRMHQQAYLHLGKQKKLSYTGKLEEDDWETIVEQSVNVLITLGEEKVPDLLSTCIGNVMLFADLNSLVSDMWEEENAGQEAATLEEALMQGEGAICMSASGSVIYISEGYPDAYYVENIDFDERELQIKLGAYNVTNNKNEYPEDMEVHYLEQDDVYKAYHDWYYYEGNDLLKQYEVLINTALYLKGISAIGHASDEELNEAIEMVNAAIKETGQYDLTNIDAIENKMKENYDE